MDGGTYVLVEHCDAIAREGVAECHESKDFDGTFTTDAAFPFAVVSLNPWADAARGDAVSA